MSAKEELIHLIDELPDKVIDKLLYYIKEIEPKSELPIDIMRDIDLIMDEDDELLKKLAQ